MANGIIGALGSPAVAGFRQGVSGNVQEFMQANQRLQEQKEALRQREMQEAQQTDQALQRGLTVFNALDKAGADDATKQQAWKAHVSPHIDEVDRGVQDINRLKQMSKILEQRQQLGPENAFEAIRSINPATDEEIEPQPKIELRGLPEELIRPAPEEVAQPDGEFTPSFSTGDTLDQPVPEGIKKTLGIPKGSDITFRQAKEAGFKVISSQPIDTSVVTVGDIVKLINMETGATVKNLGKIPTKPDPKREANERKEGLKLENRLSKSRIISEKAAKALDEAGFLTTGFIGSMLSGIRGTSAFDLDKTIDTIKANLGFEELAAMRAASPTGGALGQIAVRELEFLQSALDALDIGQSEGQLREALTNVKVHYDNIIENIEKSKSATKIPEGFTERVMSKSGKVGFRNPKTNEIFVR